jgi:hypothetical protein
VDFYSIAERASRGLDDTPAEPAVDFYSISKRKRQASPHTSSRHASSSHKRTAARGAKTNTDANTNTNRASTNSKRAAAPDLAHTYPLQLVLLDSFKPTDAALWAPFWDRVGAFPARRTAAEGFPEGGEWRLPFLFLFFFFVTLHQFFFFFFSFASIFFFYIALFFFLTP